MAAISKLDYLKKYLDGGQTEKPKKKKKRLKVGQKINNIRIVDQQISFRNSKKTGDDDYEEFDLMEEKPLLFAADGATLFSKEYEEKEKKKASSWAPVRSSELPSPKQSTNRNDSDIDLSPVRKLRQRHDSDMSDNSPPRQRRTRHDSSGDSDLSPERSKINRRNSDSDFSPSRKRNQSDSDYSPERGSSNKKTTRPRNEERPEVMSTGKKAGLQSGAELRVENEKRRKEEMQRFAEMDASVSGKGQQTVYRDRKSGKKIDFKFEELKKRREEEEKLKDTEKYAVWGRGVAQENEMKQKIEDEIHEMQKPLARYKDDKDLDSMLKEKDREGDPMLAYLKKKKNTGQKLKSSKPVYNGPTPALNRFNIWPGYRYDGVDRSNGFENKRFMEINKKKSFNNAKYKWSVEDM